MRCICTEEQEIKAAYHDSAVYYRIAGNFGEVFNLAIGEFGIDRQIKYSPIELNACTPMAVSIQIAKFNTQWRASSPNLKLAKVARYMVYSLHVSFIDRCLLCV